MRTQCPLEAARRLCWADVAASRRHSSPIPARSMAARGLRQRARRGSKQDANTVPVPAPAEARTAKEDKEKEKGSSSSGDENSKITETRQQE